MADKAPQFELLAGDAGAPETEAERVYGGALRFATRPAPHVVANFVSSIDGVVSLGLHDGTDSSTISGYNAGDRFLMAMLRAAADAVVIGAGTLRATVGHQWTAAKLMPAQEGMLMDYREALGRRRAPAPLVVVTGSGQLPSHVALTQPDTDVVILTTPDGAARVRAAFPRLHVVTAGDGRQIDGNQVIAALQRELDARLLLTEGGPSLAGSLLAAHQLHELFWTIAPWIAGRDPAHPRLALVQDFVAGPRALRPATLDSLRRSGEHLFLRYSFHH